MGTTKILRQVCVGDRTITIRATPGAVTVPPVGSIGWEGALALAEAVRRAANAAMVLEELANADQSVQTCAKCGKRVRDGVVVVEDEADPSRVRHAEGSPECTRR